jgi:hypothetical protein
MVVGRQDGMVAVRCDAGVFVRRCKPTCRVGFASVRGDAQTYACCRPSYQTACGPQTSAPNSTGGSGYLKTVIAFLVPVGSAP